MPRLFVAIPLPRDVAGEAASIVPPLPGARPVAPELMHLTLAFLGQVGEERVADVTASARAAAGTMGPFPVELRSVGRFPEHGRPSVVWLGTSPKAADAIVRLGASVRAELLRHQVPFDPKPLRAHVTLARIRDRSGDDEARAIVAAVNAARVPRDLSFVASAVHVMESRLSREGPLYSSRAELPLTGPPGRIGGRPGRIERERRGE